MVCYIWHGSNFGLAGRARSLPPYPGAAGHLRSFPLHSCSSSYYGIATIQVRLVTDVLLLSFVRLVVPQRVPEGLVS